MGGRVQTGSSGESRCRCRPRSRRASSGRRRQCSAGRCRAAGRPWRAPVRRCRLRGPSDRRSRRCRFGTLLKKSPVIVTFYRGGWCPYCNLELKAYQQILPEIAAAGASLVAISPEKPDETVSTVEKNALTCEVLSDVGQTVGRAFGLVNEFTDELKQAYRGFNLDIPARNGTPGEWALPVSATYLIDRDGVIVYAYTDVDYSDRADPREVLQVLNKKSIAA